MTDITPLRIRKSRDEIRQKALKTLLEYLEARGKLNGTADDWYEEVWKTGTEDGVFKLWLIKETPTGKEESGEEIVKKTKGKTCLVKFIDDAVTTTSGNTVLTNFMSSNEGRRKIIVMPYFNRKVFEQLMSYGDVEVFFETDLLQNILKDPLQPQFQILTNTEAAKVRREYVLQPSKIAPMYEYDPVAIALGLRHTNVLRIIVTNEGSGYIANYRIVIRTAGGRV